MKKEFVFHYEALKMMKWFFCPTFQMPLESKFSIQKIKAKEIKNLVQNVQSIINSKPRLIVIPLNEQVKRIMLSHFLPFFHPEGEFNGDSDLTEKNI